MIKTLEEMKEFLTWCRETGVVGVKFELIDRTGAPEVLPIDVILSGTPPDPVALAFGEIPHKNDGESDTPSASGDTPPATGVKITNEAGEALTDEELFGQSG